MRRLWLLVLLIALLPLSAAAQPAAAIPPSGIVWQLAGSTPGNVYAATWCGVYQLGAGGTRWQEVPGLRGIPARQLLRLEGDVLLAGTGGWSPGGIWRHAPGASWERVLDTGYAQLALSPNGATAYAAPVNVGTPSILRSDDGGRTWTEAGRIDRAGGVRHLAVLRDPATGADLLLVALQPMREPYPYLLSSADGGRTWQELPGLRDSPTQGEMETLVVDRETNAFYWTTRRYADDGSRIVTNLFRGTVAGGAGVEIALPQELASDGIGDLIAIGSWLLVGGPGGIFASVQGGAPNSWSRFDQNLNGGGLNDLLFTEASNPGPMGMTYLATNSGVYQYDADAHGWRHTAPGLPACRSDGLTVYDRVRPFESTPERRYFDETGHSLSLGFKAFWEASGGLPVFGFPLSEEFDERNLDLNRPFATQYLERERFEYHPENAGTPYTVLLGRLGAELLAAQGRDWRTEGGGDNPFGGACESFAVGEQQRAVCGPFLAYWRAQGLDLDGRPGVNYAESLALFGLPLTAPRLERNPDGAEVLTQWFERARFEYHPDNPQPYKVLLGRLGAEALQQRGVIGR